MGRVQRESRRVETMGRVKGAAEEESGGGRHREETKGADVGEWGR